MVNPKLLSESVMALGLQNPRFAAPVQSRPQISPVDSMLYMGDLLENMHKIAKAQGLGVLAHLLELARMETRMVAQDQKPGSTTQLHPAGPAGAVPL